MLRVQLQQEGSDHWALCQTMPKQNKYQKSSIALHLKEKEGKEEVEENEEREEKKKKETQ